jgi:hypothetical protein
MTDFTITITDEAKLFAIDALVAKKNAEKAEGDADIDAAGYIQMVIDRATESWARDYPMPDESAYQAALTELAKAKATATGKDATDILAAEEALGSLKLSLKSARP